MSLKSNLLKAAGLGVVVTALTAGAALAAVATSSVNVRTGPGTGYGVVDTLRPGEYVNINGRTGSWCSVSKAGPDGWVSCAYLSGGRVDVMPRFHRHPRMYDRYDHGPSVELNFGFGGPSMHVRPRPMYPWWY
jgi:uncharacterized protein YraI